MNEPVGFIGERIVQRIVRDLALKALSPDACNDIGKTIGEAIGPALYQAVERMVKFEPETESTMTYSSNPTELAAQLLAEHAGDKVMSAGDHNNVSGPLSDLFGKMFAAGIPWDKIISFGKSLIPFILPLINGGKFDWQAFLNVILQMFGKPTQGTAPTITGG